MKFTVRVPATTANLGSGVDCLGLALSLYLTVHVETAGEDSFTFSRGFDEPIPKKDNLFLSAMELYAKRAGKTLPKLKIVMESDIPVSRGLGSSSSAIIAGLLTACTVLDDEPENDRLLRLATELERHPDNVTPALLGGFTMAYSDRETLVTRSCPAPDVCYIAAVPSYRLSTRAAREVLPKEVPLKTAIAQLQRAVVLSGELAAGRTDALAALTRDEFFTPCRKGLMPGYDAAIRAAYDRGALCAMTSGAGPTILALCEREYADGIGDAMKAALSENGVDAQIRTLSADNVGAVVTDIEAKK